MAPTMRLPLAALAAISLLSACATITRGTEDSLLVESSPAGAQVHTSNGFACDATPCSLKMSRKSMLTVNITKAGYQPAAVSVISTVKGAGGAAMAGNLLIGGIPGAVVDVATGATLSLDPNPVSVTLKPLSVRPARAGQVGS
jgi:hypothetical protein